MIYLISLLTIWMLLITFVGRSLMCFPAPCIAYKPVIGSRDLVSFGTSLPLYAQITA